MAIIVASHTSRAGPISHLPLISHVKEAVADTARKISTRERTDSAALSPLRMQGATSRAHHVNGCLLILVAGLTLAAKMGHNNAAAIGAVAS